MTGDLNDSGACLGGEAIEDVLGELQAIRGDLVTAAAVSQQLLERVHTNYRASARNLLHYLALRRRDLRPLQSRLATLGLSSLGRAESHVLATVDAVLVILHRLIGLAWQTPTLDEWHVDFARGNRLLAEHSESLLGTTPPGRGVRIMVTMPSEAGDDYTLVHDLLKQGMDCMRINCAHDGAARGLGNHDRVGCIGNYVQQITNRCTRSRGSRGFFNSTSFAGADRALGHFRVDRLDDDFNASGRAALVPPGNSAQSPRISIVRGQRADAAMAAAHQLSEPRVDVLRAGIEAGAEWPEKAGDR